MMQVWNVSDLDEKIIDQLWQLYSPHHSMMREEFDERVNTLDKLAVFFQKSSENIYGQLSDMALIGFCGIRFKTFTLKNNKKIAAFYLGLTYVKPAWRAKGLIQRLVVKMMIKPCLSPRYHRVCRDSLRCRVCRPGLPAYCPQ